MWQRTQQRMGFEIRKVREMRAELTLIGPSDLILIGPDPLL